MSEQKERQRAQQVRNSRIDEIMKLEAENTRLRDRYHEAAKLVLELRAALAEETQRAEAAEVAVQVDARREIEVDLAEANANTRDMAKQAEQLRAALADETQRADRESAEVSIQVEARQEIEAALAEAERKYHQNLTELAQTHLKALDKRDAALAEAERTNADQYREHMACITEQKTRAERAEIDLAAAREIIERITACLEMSTSGYISSSRYHEEWEKRRNSATIDARAFLERTAAAAPQNEK